MLYKKINVELIVVADEAEAVVADLNAALDRLEKRHTLFGGGIETVAFEHPGTEKRSALAHTMAAGEAVALAVRAAGESVSVALSSPSLDRTQRSFFLYFAASESNRGSVAVVAWKITVRGLGRRTQDVGLSGPATDAPTTG
jgi:hypothetical protein